MASLDITVATSVLALLRRDVTPSCVADRFGVTEAEVLEWQDVFVVAGVLALAEFQRGGKVYAHLGCDPDKQPGPKHGTLKPPTTFPPCTTPELMGTTMDPDVTTPDVDVTTPDVMDAPIASVSPSRRRR